MCLIQHIVEWFCDIRVLLMCASVQTSCSPIHYGGRSVAGVLSGMEGVGDLKQTMVYLGDQLIPAPGGVAVCLIQSPGRAP